MTEAEAGVGVLVRLGSSVVGGLLVSAAVLKLLSGTEFAEWMARLLREDASPRLKRLAATAIGAEIAVGGALLVQPVRPILSIAWWFFLGLSAIQLAAWIRGVGACACFGSPSESRESPLAPFLAPALLVCVSVFWLLEPWARLRLVLLEDLLLAGAALACSLTLLIIVESPRGIQRLRIPEARSR